jgi:hypothetical protein
VVWNLRYRPLEFRPRSERFGHGWIRRPGANRDKPACQGGSLEKGKKNRARGRVRKCLGAPKLTKNTDSNGSLQRAISWQPGGAFAQDLGEMERRRGASYRRN